MRMKTLATAFALVCTVANGVSLRRSGCPPCQDVALISGAATADRASPCGCGGSGLVGLSSQSELEAKTTDELEKMLTSLGAEISDLETKLESQTEQQTERMLQEEQRLSQLNTSAAAQAAKASETRSAVKANQTTVAANVSKIETEALSFGRNASEARAQRSNLTLVLSALVARAAAECTACEEVVLVEQKLGLNQYGPLVHLSLPSKSHRLGLLRRGGEVASTSLPPPEVDPRVVLIRKVMAAEEKAAVLKKEIADSLMRAGEKQQKQLDAFDKLKSKIARQTIDSQQASARLADRFTRLESQMSAALAYRDAQEAAFSKVQEDVAALEADLKQLTAAMTLCGCY